MHTIENIICDFCKSGENDEIRLGKLYTYDGLKAHYFCMLLSPSLYQSNKETEGILGFMPKFIKEELKRAKRLKCYICNQRGASLGCCNKRCRKTFHLPCGISQKCINQFFEKYESFCSKHSPVQDYQQNILTIVQESTKQNICGICCEEVNSIPDYNTLWTVCCQNGWFHRDCIMNLAKNSGYHFFKCPLCNNQEQFSKEMLRMGIYIPDQDASWELEPHAFEDLLYKHNQCDSDTCKCPFGREHNQKNSPWSILLCKSCGSAGTHRSCRTSKGKFYCSLCYDVNKRYSSQFSRKTRNSCNTSLNDISDPEQILNDSNKEGSCSSHNCSYSSNDSNNSFIENKENMIPNNKIRKKLTPYILRSRQRLR